MKIPKQLKIFGHQYEAVEDKNFHELSGFAGEFDFKKHKITIAKDFPTTAKEEVLLHELIHAASYYLKLELTEQQVHALSSGLYNIWKDNKK